MLERYSLLKLPNSNRQFHFDPVIFAMSSEESKLASVAKKGRGLGKRWFTYPQLHDSVMDMFAPHRPVYRFHGADDDESNTAYHDTFIMGIFVCRRCNSSWMSKKVAIHIRCYVGNRYNTRVYLQRCKKCKSLGRFVVDEACYAERVVYRLKVWSRIKVERPPFKQAKRTKPHEQRLCEGCALGRCTWNK